jgi:hypothetical protein
VLLAGPPAEPSVLDHCVVDLSDPDVPESRQPYHAGFGTAQQDAAEVTRLSALVERYTQHSVASLVARYWAAGHHLRGAAVVIGSDTDPDTIANPHVRAHAAEGRLFRGAVEAALERCDVSCLAVLERDVFARAATHLGRAAAELRQAVTRLGRSRGGRWRAEEKAAATAAWLVLASQPSSGRHEREREVRS